MSIHRVFLMSMGMGLAGLLSGFPAAGYAEDELHGLGVEASTAASTCFFVNPSRVQCNFAPLATTQAKIQYVAMQCGSTGIPFSLAEVQVLTTPPKSTSEVSYQIPLTNRLSLDGVVNAASPVAIYAKANSGARALIDFTPAPTGSTQCSVSLAGEHSVPEQ
jgi:hypothetical protein